MKKLNSFLSLLLLLFTVSVFGQTRVYAPALSLPEDGEIGVAPNVVLDWKAVTGGTLEVMYELQLADNADFNNAITFPKTDLTSAEMNELSFGNTYYWRVKAYDGDDVSDWSEEWSFSVASTVELDQPSDGAMTYAQVNISWNELSGLNKYQIQIDTSYIWNNVVIPSSDDIFGSYIVDENNMWVVGDNGAVLHFDGSSWNIVDAGTTEALNSIYFVDASTGFACGANGTVLSYDGSAWTSLDAGTTENLNAVAFADADNGYFVGDGGTIVKYASGTFTIEEAFDGTSTITKDFYGIDVIAADNYWACGKGKYILNYDGSAWSGSVEGGKDHYDVAANSATDIWVSSKTGRINHFNGTEWTEISGIVTKDLYSIAFSGTTGYAVGKSGTMLSYDGNEWSQITSGTASNLNCISLFGDYGIAGGDGAALINKAGEGFNSPFAKTLDVIKDSNNVDVNNLLFGKTFYYRIRGIHSADTTDWSSAKAFTTYAFPELESPSDGASNQALEIVFEWTEYTGVTRYYIEVSNTEDFSSSLNYISDSNSVSINGFNFSETYYWRVRAQHPDDLSDWTEAYSFNTVDAITLVSPEDNATGVVRSVNFSWEEVLGAPNYQISYAKSDDFSDAETFMTEKASYQVLSPLDEKETYYWKVRGIAGLDTSSWSPVWMFQIEGPDAINDNFNESSVKVYPNPSNGTFNLELNSSETSDYSVSITDISGKVIETREISAQNGNNIISFGNNNDLEAGVYLVNIKKGDAIVTKRLFVK